MMISNQPNPDATNAATSPRSSVAFDRRSLLVGGVTVFTAGMLASQSRAQTKSARSDTAPPRTLLLLELNGGNDGLSMVVPYKEDVYYRSRPRTAHQPADVLRLDDYRGWHPKLKGLRKFYDEGKLGLVEGTGYPEPNHSHFTSQDIWHTARATGRASGDGWVGRLLAQMYPDDRLQPHGVHVGQSLPYALTSATHPMVCFDSPPAYRWAKNGGVIAEASAKKKGMDARPIEAASPLAKIKSSMRNAQQSSVEVRRAAAEYKAKVAYPETEIGQDLKVAASLLASQIGVRVMSVTQGAYDTHENQRYRHDNLMAELDQGLSAFFDDVRGTPHGDNVLVLVFSEFGRRVEDNASLGTDHGTAGPMLLLGSAVRGGLYGRHPDMSRLIEADMIHTTDFRTVYATVIERWFGLSSEAILGGRYAPIENVLA